MELTSRSTSLIDTGISGGATLDTLSGDLGGGDNLRTSFILVWLFCERVLAEVGVLVTSGVSLDLVALRYYGSFDL